MGNTESANAALDAAEWARQKALMPLPKEQELADAFGEFRFSQCFDLRLQLYHMSGALIALLPLVTKTYSIRKAEGQLQRKILPW